MNITNETSLENSYYTLSSSLKIKPFDKVWRKSIPYVFYLGFVTLGVLKTDFKKHMVLPKKIPVGQLDKGWYQYSCMRT